jgi:uncharacterized protein (DUF2141 family)
MEACLEHNRQRRHREDEEHEERQLNLTGHKALKAMMFAGTLSMAERLAAADLELAIEGIRNAEGQILVSLYYSADTFLQQAAYHQIVSARKRDVTGKVSVRFQHVPPGTYAAAVVHDQDGDARLSTNMLGIPNEPYGFSAGARGRFGPPSFQEASFVLPQTGTAIVVKVD